ncbi:MAG: hypothetical protein PHS54_00155 [Clostridia bacterium]|nr:hypothetical protein [Clostridia bacterium]
MQNEKELKGTKGSTTNKIKKLQRQYNKILVDLFDQFAAESIEEALDKSDGSFGENIQDIVQNALDNLKGKVMQELGVKGNTTEIGIAIGGDLTGGMSDFMSGMSEEENEGEEDETPEHEEEESDAFEAGEQAAGDTDEDDSGEDDDDDKLEEKAPPGKKMERMVKHIKKSAKKSGKGEKESKKIAYATAWKKHNESDGSLKNDKIISESRRNDQASLMDAYMSMFKETK